MCIRNGQWHGIICSKLSEGIRIASIPEYKEYCYYVAGTVGVLLTDLWKIHGRKIDNNIFNELSKKCCFIW